MKSIYYLDGLCCANCATKIEEGMNKLEGVSKATVNLFTTKMIIEGEEEKMTSILTSAKKLINKIEPDVIIKKG